VAQRVPVGRPGNAARAAPTWAQRLRRWGPHVPIAVLIAAYGIRFSLLSVAVRDGYGTPAFDMGIPDQGIWLLSRFHAPFVTIMGRDLFADHTSFILVLLVPLYWVYPHTAALLVVQSWLLALAAVPIYLLARHLLAANLVDDGRAPGPWTNLVPTALAGAYLLNPALQWGNLEQFHVECFLVVFIATAIYAALRWRPWLLGFCLVGCLLCKEDAAVLVVPLGLWIALRRSRQYGIATVLGAATAAAVSTEVVILSLLGTTTAHGGRLPFGGLAGTLRTAWHQPGRMWTYLRQDNRPWYLWQMGSSAGLAFLRAPEIALIGTGVAGINVISAFSYTHRIRYHYSMPLVAVLAMGTVWGVSRLATAGRRHAGTAAVAGCAIVACTAWGLAPFSAQGYPHWSPGSAEVADIDYVLHHLPPDAVVSADYSLVSHVDHRTRVYMWPTPFAATYWGTFKQEGQRLPFANQVEYVAIPTGRLGLGALVWRSIAPHFRLVAARGGFGLYRRVAPD